MFKLIYKLFALSMMVIGVIAAVYLTTPRNNISYFAAASDKFRLLHAAKSPRIILAGGSNIAFSVNSQKISRYFGMPVVNMGLHANLGLRFILNEIEPALKSGDIVIIFPEYEHFSIIPLDGRPKELGAVIRSCPECISGVKTPGQAFNAASGILQTLEGGVLSNITSQGSETYEQVYIRNGFNEWGDMVAHLDQSYEGNPPKRVSRVEINSTNRAIETLNSFYRSCVTANVRVFFMFPAIPIYEYKAKEKNFAEFYDYLNANLKISILGTPKDFAYPRNMFYDTVYHMNRAGRDEHTDHIIDILDVFLQSADN